MISLKLPICFQKLQTASHAMALAIACVFSESRASGYGLKEIDAWARRVVAWAKGREPADGERVVDQPAPKRERRDVFLYFDNGAKVRAPVDAKKLVARLSQLLKES